MKKLKILVTGAGSGVGQSIVKSLKISKINAKIIFADIDYYNAGLYRVKDSIIVPKTEKPGALEWFLKYLKKFKIDVLMVGSEHDLIFFSKNKDIIKDKTNCEVCVSNIKLVKMANDKYLTQEFLKKNNLPHLKTFAPKSLKEALLEYKNLKLPFILKSRIGTSSKNVHIIKNKKQFITLFPFIKKPILQEHIGPVNNDLKTEYTCSFFTKKNKEVIGPFIIKRKLVNGTSWITEVVDNKKIKKLVLKISQLIENIGSFNIQLRTTKKGPIPFEFNPRFSGTTSIRAYFGFNEPEMFIKDYIYNQNLKKILIKKGMCMRYNEEIFLNQVNLRSLKKKCGKGIINKWF